MNGVLHADIPVLDQILNAHAGRLGDDFEGYRNHAYRVANMCAEISSADGERLQRIAIAAAFHDLGIWTEGTFDYVPPSIDLANAHLANSGEAPWAPEIETMIREHHKLTPYRAQPAWLVESFRRADLVDVSRGVVAFGLPRKFVGELFERWPSAGFHKKLVQLTLKQARIHPWNPLPMIHW